MMNRSATRPYGWALLAGLPLALLAASSSSPSTTVSIPRSGRPIWWRVYNPFSVLWWAWSWGLTPTYRAGFLSGLSLDAVVWLLPAAVLRLREVREPLAAEERPAGSRLGMPPLQLGEERKSLPAGLLPVSRRRSEGPVGRWRRSASCTISPRASATRRWISFSSSRMLPGQL